jgi:hypothetical protein
MILRNGKFSWKNIAENFPYGKIFHLTSLRHVRPRGHRDRRYWSCVFLKSCREDVSQIAATLWGRKRLGDSGLDCSLKLWFRCKLWGQLCRSELYQGWRQTESVDTSEVRLHSSAISQSFIISVLQSPETQPPYGILKWMHRDIDYPSIFSFHCRCFLTTP